MRRTISVFHESPPRPPRGGRSSLLLSFAVVASLVAACSGSGGGSAPPSGLARRPEPAAARVRRQAAVPPEQRENVAFYYQGIGPRTNLAKLGSVKIVVAGIQRDGAAAAAAIKQTGAQAYRYIQSYWFPSTRSFDGLDIASHRDWAFCTQGRTPKVGRTDATGTAWWFVDMNEQAVQNHFRERLQALRAEGWDGVFFDRGYASLTGIDSEDWGVWNRASTCTDRRVQRSPTFADSYVSLLSVAQQSGLSVMMNYGVSPFDESTPLRPDSRNAACAARDVAGCPRLDDVWGSITWVLDEAIAHPRDVAWKTDFKANLANEQDAEHGGRVVGLLTTATLGTQNRKNVYYGWARTKLFAIPLGVNTGDRGCAGVVTACNRHALYPELAGIHFGRPIDERPRSRACDRRSTIRCLWTRRYEQGMSIVNVAPHARSTGEIPLGVKGCRYVLDVWSGRPLADNKCVTSVVLELRAWSGHPLEYSTSPF